MFLRKETLDFEPFRLESRIIFLHDLDAMSSLTNDSDYPAVRANGSRAGLCHQRLAIAAGGSCAAGYATVQDVAAHSPDIEMLPLSK